MESETVDKIEFESIQVPVFQCIDIQIHEMFPDFRETKNVITAILLLFFLRLLVSGRVISPLK